IVHDHVLARQLILTTKLGRAVPMQYVQPVVKAFFAAGLA
ncbi:EscU/YscU/HrcU family type III secretion system export apparatus switch protein, partial [bacterium M00.F.Ca.ET.191.01.1.1]